jgi:hypothetical protein
MWAHRVRFFVVNAGPTFDSDFHVVGAIFDGVYPDGNPRHALENVQTYLVPAGGGVVFETVFEKGASGEGLYPFVTHAFAERGKRRRRNHSGRHAEDVRHHEPLEAGGDRVMPIRSVDARHDRSGAGVADGAGR